MNPECPAGFTEVRLLVPTHLIAALESLGMSRDGCDRWDAVSILGRDELFICAVRAFVAKFRDGDEYVRIFNRVSSKAKADYERRISGGPS
jgi:hypothetical protein